MTTDSDVQAELSVRRPEIDSLELRDQQAVTVTNRSTDPEHLNRLSVRARYNFDAVDRLNVTVVGPSGATVATGRITESRGLIRVEISDPVPGVYTVTAAGSGVDAASRTATVRVRGTTATPTATATTTPASAPTTTTSTTTPTPTGTPLPATPTRAEQPATPTDPATATVGDGHGFGVLTVLAAALALTAVALARRH